MTSTTDNPARARRIADAWTNDPTLTEAEVTALVDAELEAEAAERAEQERASEAMVASMNRLMFTCAACKGPRIHTARDALCDKCRPVVVAVTAERNGSEVVSDGRTRREYVLAYLDSRQS
jgi:hypothetical protein